MLTLLSIICIAAANILFFSRRCLRYLFHFQQLSYSRRYFKNWLIENGVYDRKGTLIVTLCALCAELIKSNELSSLLLYASGSICLVLLGFWEPDPRKGNGLRLEITQRAVKIYWRSLILYSCASIVSFAYLYHISDDDDLAAFWLISLLLIQSSPLWLILAKTKL